MELEQKIAVSREITQTNYQLKMISLRNEIRNFVMEEENLSNNIFVRFLNSPSLLATIKATEIIELKIGLIKEKFIWKKANGPFLVPTLNFFMKQISFRQTLWLTICIDRCYP